MADSGVRVERAHDVAWVTLDRPPLNLFDPALIAALTDAFAGLARDPGLRAAVLTGAGRAFTAGMNVNVLRELDAASGRRLITSLHDAIDAVHRAPFPVIAAVNGACLGAGFELALACDLRVAADTAIFGLPEVRVGVPSVIQAALLPAIVGPARAAEMLLLGGTVTAPQAAQWALVNRTVAPAELHGAVQAWLSTLSACAPNAVRLQKELIVRWRETDLAAAVRAGIDVFARAYATGEPREGADAFLGKRAPRFGEAR
ncbi:MAG TPA: enoyl-CoA hydratase-related protein [Candidatus Limnocylindria bacterium]|nr:enoyl-CoA hydratase-related protein [Candidatus Limnocylindria bacterium]